MTNIMLSRHLNSSSVLFPESASRRESLSSAMKEVVFQPLCLGTVLHSIFQAPTFLLRPLWTIIMNTCKNSQTDLCSGERHNYLKEVA